MPWDLVSHHTVAGSYPRRTYSLGNTTKWTLFWLAQLFLKSLTLTLLRSYPPDKYLSAWKERNKVGVRDYKNQGIGIKGHLGVNDLWFKFLKKGSLYPQTLMYFHGTSTQWSLGRVTHVTATEMGSNVIKGSMTFGSSFWRKGHCIHLKRFKSPLGQGFFPWTFLAEWVVCDMFICS